MNDIVLCTHRLSQAPGDFTHLHQVARTALRQTERVFAMLKHICDAHLVAAFDPTMAQESQALRVRENARVPNVMFASEVGQKPLTKRQREALSLISEGCTNKQGALRMNISRRTFEDHRAQVLRKVGTRNTVELIHKVMSLQINC